MARSTAKTPNNFTSKNQPGSKFHKNRADSKPGCTQTNENTYFEFVLAQFYTYTSCKTVYTQMTHSSISEVMVSVATVILCLNVSSSTCPTATRNAISIGHQKRHTCGSESLRGSNPCRGETLHALPDQPRGPPSLLTMGTGSFPEVKQPGSGGDHPGPSSTDFANGFELYLRCPSVPA